MNIQNASANGGCSGVSVRAAELDNSSTSQTQRNCVGAGDYAINHQRSTGRLSKGLRPGGRAQNQGSVDRVGPAGVRCIDRAACSGPGAGKRKLDARVGIRDVISGRRSRREVQFLNGKRCAQVGLGDRGGTENGGITAAGSGPAPTAA